MITYPYQDLSLNDREGETWKDITGLESYFQISSHGRIKRLAGKRKNSKSIYSSVNEKIIAQVASECKNRYTGDSKYYLRVGLSLNNRIYNYSISRLVYFEFVEKFDLNDKNLLVYSASGDTLDTRSSNLRIGSQQDKQQRMKSSGRKESFFLKVSAEQRKVIQEKINATRAKKNNDEISRYSLSGKLIQTYNNAEVAARAIGCTANLLSKAARGKLLTYKGFIWRRGRELEIDLSGMSEIKGIGYSPLSKTIKRIGKYDLTGKLTERFGTIVEASRLCRLDYGSISMALNGSLITAGGYLWRYSYAKTINVSKLKKLPGYFNSPLSAAERQVSRYDFNGIWQQTYDHVADASRKSGVNRKNIYQAINGKSISAGGFLWLRGTTLRLNPNIFKKRKGFEASPLGRYQKERKLKEHLV